MTIRLHRGDLPDLARYTGAVAIDTETMGLEPARDRLCVVQLSPGDGSADVVQIAREIGPAPNLKALLADASKLKIFHFARFDIAVLYKFLGVMPGPVYCTKIASRLTRTYTDKHGLKDLVKDMLGKDISKQQQLTDWGAEQLTEAQVAYMLGKVPRGRFVEVEEAAAMVAFMLSDENSFTTGATFDLSGGRATY